jgi:imidazolonepropionase-like amidohydrolase
MVTPEDRVRVKKLAADDSLLQLSLTTTSIRLDSREAQAAIQFFKEHGTVLDPTLAGFELFVHSKDQPIETFEPGITKVGPQLASQLASWGLPSGEAAPHQQAFRSALHIIGALHRAGIPIVAGTDQMVPGHSLHRELELYVQSGFTPMEALQAATIVPARAMKLEGDVGTIEPGKRADLIIVDGDPVRDIHQVRQVATVITNGRIYDCAKLRSFVFD